MAKSHSTRTRESSDDVTGGPDPDEAPDRNFIERPPQLTDEQFKEIERRFTDDEDGGPWRRAALASLTRSGAQLAEAMAVASARHRVKSDVVLAAALCATSMTGLIVLAFPAAAGGATAVRGAVKARSRTQQVMRQDAVLDATRMLRQLLETGATSVNTAHKAGFDLSGAPGGNFFNAIAAPQRATLWDETPPAG